MRSQWFFSLALLTLCACALDAGDDRKAPAAEGRFLFELSDGSSVIGTPLFQVLPVESSLGRVEVAIAKLEMMEFPDDHASVTLHLSNGDKLTGKSGLQKFEFQAIFGKVSLEIAQLKKSKRYGSVALKLKQLMDSGKNPEEITLTNLRQIGLACKQYSVDNNDVFPNDPSQLVPGNYLAADAPVWHSPYDPDDKKPSYRIIPNLTEAADSETVLIEETVVHDGKRGVFCVGGQAKMVPAKD